MKMMMNLIDIYISLFELQHLQSRVNTLQVQLIMYNYRSISNIACQICQGSHAANQSCKLSCIYCHSYHDKNDMVENICPKMLKFAQQIRPSSQLTCKDCLGQGILQKSIKTTYLQSKSKYQKRIKQFRSLPQNEGKEQPKRILVKTEQNSSQHICNNCVGSGIIYKVINCCLKGCRLCNYQRCYINPKWQLIKIQHNNTICEKTINCSYCWQFIKIDERYFSEHCNHVYHSKCYKQNGWECHCYNIQIRQTLHQMPKEKSLQQQQQWVSNIESSDDEEYKQQMELYNSIYQNRRQI